jgi:hypothetical protein
MKNIILSTLVVLSLPLSAAIPKQSDVLKNGVGRYFKTLPKTIATHTAHSLKMGDYHLLENEHALFQSGKKSSTPFDVFYTNAKKRYPGPTNTFPFLNSGEDFKSVMQVEYGVCAGMSISIRRFNMLAYFDPSNSYKEAVPAKGSTAWITFYNQKIDQVLTYKKPAIFPGFSSMLEISSHPSFKEYFQQHVVKEWADSASAMWRGVAQQLYSVTGTFSLKEAEDLHKELSYKTKKLGYSPIVWLAKPNSNPFSSNQWIHVMQVLDVTPRNSQGAYKIKVWNENYPSAQAAQDVVVAADGTPTFEGDKLAEVEVLHFDDFEIGEMIKNKLNFCADHRGLCTKK